MAERNSMQMLSALMGEQGQNVLQMIQRMERLQKLMGTPKPVEVSAVAEKEPQGDLFSRSKNENMISAAIPFLDREYQKEIYVIVRLMEMRRVLVGGFLEARERQEEPPALRRKHLLRAIQPYLPETERNQMESILKMMTMKEILGQEDKK